MTKIPIITQNFSSPDVFTDTPLMLLPQPPPPQLPDRDQDGFSQLLLHDLHRHRQSYVRSFTAFETLKKRHDFVLRQENLRSLQNFEQRISTKQDQYIDQSFHSYEQCFVKVINGNSTTNGNIQDQQKRPKTAAPSFDKYHMHQLSHIPATPLDPPIKTPFNRYQKSHRPPLPPKYRTNANIYRSAQSFHDAFQSSSFTNQSQPFLSFTEGYLQKYGDRSSNKFPVTTVHDEMDDIKENEEGEDEHEHDKQIRSASAELNHTINSNRKQIPKSKTPDLQRLRATVSSRNTNTPSSSPQLGYNDAVRDGLIMNKDHDDHRYKMSVVNEKRRSSQQSTSQISTTSSKKSTKRPKTAKKKQVVAVDLTSDKKAESLSTKTTDGDLLLNSMIVQNYGSNIADQNPSLKIEHLPVPINLQLKKPPSPLRRSSIKSNDDIIAIKHSLDNIDTQMTTTAAATEQIEPTKEQQVITDDKQDQILATITNNITETKQPVLLEPADNRKRIKKGAFDVGESMNDMIAFELGMMGSQRGAMKKNKVRFGKENKNENEDKAGENQGTLDLLEKIRQSSTGISIGQMPVSQQSCRFELPFDLKLLETLTPLDYLSKYCRLSSRRNYQFKRIFDKHRNNQYRFESTSLYTAITEIHTETFTRLQYDNLCQLINIGSEQHQFTFDTFAGILALCERILYGSSSFRSGLDEPELAKETIEKCDFDSLERKLDGLRISQTMKKLLQTL